MGKLQALNPNWFLLLTSLILTNWILGLFPSSLYNPAAYPYWVLTVYSFILPHSTWEVTCRAKQLHLLRGSLLAPVCTWCNSVCSVICLQFLQFFQQSLVKLFLLDLPDSLINPRGVDTQELHSQNYCIWRAVHISWISITSAVNFGPVPVLQDMQSTLNQILQRVCVYSAPKRSTINHLGGVVKIAKNWFGRSPGKNWNRRFPN